MMKLTTKRFFAVGFLVFFCCFSPSLQNTQRAQQSLRRSSQTTCQSSNNDGTCSAETGNVVQEIVSAWNPDNYSPRGMAVTLVRNWSETFTTTFGYKNKGETPVDAETKFALGSLSMPFTATLLGVLLTEHKDEYPAGFKTKVREVMEDDFTLAEPWLTRELDLVDVLSHRTGLYSYRRFLEVGLSSKRSLQSYCRQLDQMKVYGQFRVDASFSDLMYLLASCIAEKIGGENFPSLMKTRLLDRLEMSNTGFVGDVVADGWEKLATMYYEDDDKAVLPLDFKLLNSTEVMTGAVGVISTVGDMSKWLKFHLSGGLTSRGERLVDASYWSEMSRMHMISEGSFPNVERARRFPFSINTDIFGLGWKIGSYRGHQLMHISGEMGGYFSQMSLFPDIGAGVFTTQNGLAGETGFQTASHIYLLDYLIGERSWLNSSTISSFPSPWLDYAVEVTTTLTSKTSAAEEFSLQPVDNLPALVLNHADRYLGYYTNPLFGRLIVSLPQEDIVQTLYPGKPVLEFTLGAIGRGLVVFSSPQVAPMILKSPLTHRQLGNGMVFTFTAQTFPARKYEEVVISGIERGGVTVAFRRDFTCEENESSTGDDFPIDQIVQVFQRMNLTEAQLQVIKDLSLLQ